MSTSNDKIGAGSCQRPREILAEPAAGAGDDGNATREVKEWVGHKESTSGAEAPRGLKPTLHRCWREDHLHQIRMAFVQAFKPLRTLFERGHDAD